MSHARAISCQGKPFRSVLAQLVEPVSQVSQLECFLESLESEIQELVGLEGPMLELHPKCLEEGSS